MKVSDAPWVICALNDKISAILEISVSESPCTGHSTTIYNREDNISTPGPLPYGPHLGDIENQQKLNKEHIDIDIDVIGHADFKYHVHLYMSIPFWKIR